MFGGDGEKRIPITITLSDGSAMTGSVPSGHAASLATELNREGLFLNFKDSSGQTMFIAKSGIARVQEGQVAKEVRLPSLPDGRDPYKVLRLPAGATSEMIRSSYLLLARQYHPDNYSGETIPSEIRDYATGIFQQVTAAYQLLKAQLSDAA